MADGGRGGDAATLLASLTEGAAGADQSLETLVRPLLRLVAELSGLEAVYLTRVDWDEGVQHIDVVRNAGGSFTVPEGAAIPWQDSLCELSLAAESRWNTDVQGTWGDRQVVRDLGVQSYISIPVQLAEEARPYGTLCGASPRRLDPDPRVVELLELVATYIEAGLERDRAVARADARAAYAEERLEGRIAFAAQVEHAMRTPLTVVRGWVETLQTHRGDEELLTRGLATIDATAERLTDQVSALLAEARSAIGSGQVEAVEVHVLARSLRGVAAAHPYEVVGTLSVVADPVAVAVLVEHLVENAVTHTPDGTPIRVVMAPGTLVVEDDGPGLPDRDDLLEPFVSADPAVRGTGLGLHIVASIVERAGWGLELGASPSGGARFTVTFR